MNVIINETQKKEDLTIIDSNIEWTLDLLGNCGVNPSYDGQYHMDQEDYAWWKKYIEGCNATEQEIASLIEETGAPAEEIRKRVWEYLGQMDMEDERGRATHILAEIADEYGVPYVQMD